MPPHSKKFIKKGGKIITKGGGLDQNPKKKDKRKETKKKHKKQPKSNQKTNHGNL